MSEIASSSRNEALTARSREWWVADEEPEIVSAQQGHRPRLPRWARQRTAMVLGLAAAGLCAAILL
jgi:hypothetical protein